MTSEGSVVCSDAKLYSVFFLKAFVSSPVGSNFCSIFAHSCGFFDSMCKITFLEFRFCLSVQDLHPVLSNSGIALFKSRPSFVQGPGTKPETN